MSLFNRKADTALADYDSINAIDVQTNLLMVTEPPDRQKIIKKMRPGSLVTLTRTKSKGQNVYVVTDLKTGKVIGEISYGTSDYLAQNYPKHHMLGKVTEIGRLTPLGHGIQVKIEYKVYL